MADKNAPKQPEKTETSAQQTAAEVPPAAAAKPPQETAGPAEAKTAEPKPPAQLHEEDDDRPTPSAQNVGRAIAHLERMNGGPVLALLVEAVAGDLMHHREIEDDEFEILEAMLQELEQHDNLAHLTAARKALA